MESIGQDRPEGRRRALLLLAGIVLVYLSVRLPLLLLDPPDSLVTHYRDAASSMYDEGWWTANARQWALTGHFLGTGLDLGWLSPVFTALQSVAFAIGGVSLASARAVSLTAGLVSILFLFGLGSAGRDADRHARRVAAGAALWLAFAFVPSHFGRLALPETTGTAFGVAGAWLLVRGGTLRGVAAGLLCGLAMLTKPHLGVVVPAFAVAAGVLAARRGQRVVPAIARVLVAAALPVLLWAIFAASHREAVAPLVAFYNTGRWVPNGSGPAAWVALVKFVYETLTRGVVYRHSLLLHAPVLFVIGVLAVPTIVRTALHPARHREISDATIVMGSWAVVGGLLLSAISYQPLRYFVPVFPALAWLASSALLGAPVADSAPASEDRGIRGRLFAALRWIAVAVLAAQVAFAVLYETFVPAVQNAARGGDLNLLHPTPFDLTAFLHKLVGAGSLEPLLALPRGHAYGAATVLSAAAAGVVGLLAATLLFRRTASWFRPAVPARWRRFVVGGAVAIQLVLWGAWWPQRADTVHAAGVDLGRRLGPAALVSPGGTFALDNRVRFSSVSVRDGKGHMFDASGTATHFLCLERHPRGPFIPEGAIEEQYPGSERLTGYRFTGGYVFGLYRAAAPATP
jgi:4-amino-4-deoxy-L-arabinose transferase-like glycosyltransferase